jgi:hypothetical protein
MKKLLLVLMSICICGVALASPPNRPNIYTQNTIIDPVAVTGNEVPLYTYLQSGVDTYKAGSITEAAISPTADIVYGQLNLSNSVLGSDIASTAALSVASVATSGNIVDGGTLGVTGATTLSGTFLLGSVNQGDILYDNGTSIVRLVPGTSGLPLVTQGASANPRYTTVGAVGVSHIAGAYVSQSMGIVYTAATDGTFTASSQNCGSSQYITCTVAGVTIAQEHGSAGVTLGLSCTVSVAKGETWEATSECTASGTSDLVYWKPSGS